MADDDDDTFWTSTRHWKHFEDRKYFDRLIDRIEELRDQTDPAKGDASAEGKDAAAFRALRYANDLVTALVGWAIAHQAGLAAEGLSFVPYGPWGDGSEPPQQREAIAAVDAHRHELAGDKLVRGLHRREMDPMTARRIAINLLAANPGAMPDGVARTLHDALLALDLNDVRPILAPTPADRKVTFAEERLQLEIICFAYFRAATDLMTLAQAQREVAEAFGVSADTLRKWEPRLRETLGHLKVSRDIQFARNGGEQIAALVATIGKLNARPHMMSDEFYGDASVLRAVERYRRRKT